MNDKKALYWSRIYVSIDLRILQKAYCCKCGQKMKRKIRMTYHTKKIIFKYRYSDLQSFYYCKCCNYYIEYINYKEIKKLQKINGSYILPSSKQLIKKLKQDEKQFR